MSSSERPGWVRDISSPSGQFDDREILETWVHAKKQGYVGSNARVPNRALNEAAVRMGVADYSDIGPREIGSGEDAFTISETLPADQYNAAIEGFEDHFGVSPGRSKVTTESAFENPDVTEENSLELFGELFLDDDPDRGDDPTFDEPRVSTNPCWTAYLEWCDINNVEPKSQQKKADMVNRVEGEKKKAKLLIDGEKATRACYKGVHLTDDGWWLYNNA